MAKSTCCANCLFEAQDQSVRGAGMRVCLQAWLAERDAHWRSTRIFLALACIRVPDGAEAECGFS